MKSKLLVFPLLIVPLVSCSASKEIRRNSFYFDTYTESRLYEGNESNLDDIEKIFTKIDKLTDNFNARDLNNVYKVNTTTENVEIEPELYEVLKLSFSSDLDSLNYFNPLCGSLSKKWKESLANKQVLDQTTIDAELLKLQSTHLEFVNETTVKRVGEAEIDLGAVAKGYALDKVKDYLDQQDFTKYLIDAGSSSLLLGEKKNNKNFKIKIEKLDNTYIHAKNCFISTSSSSRQKVEIDGQIYSHIINPITGSAINEHDAVIVVSSKGYLGDILSTAFINESLDSIKELEQHFEVKTIVIDNSKIVYQNEGIEVTNKWKKI